MPIYLRHFYFKSLRAQIDKENEEIEGAKSSPGPKIDKPPQIKKS